MQRARRAAAAVTLLRARWRRTADDTREREMPWGRRRGRVTDLTELTRRFVVRATVRARIGLDMWAETVGPSRQQSVEHARRSEGAAVDQQHQQRDGTCEFHRRVALSIVQ